MVLRPSRGFLCPVLETEQHRTHTAGRSGHWESQVKRHLLLELRHTANLYRARSPPLLFKGRKADFRDGGGASPAEGVPSRGTAAREPGCRGRGFASPSSVTGFNGSVNRGIRGLSSCFICSKPSLQANGLYQITFLHFSFRLLSPAH